MSPPSDTSTPQPAAACASCAARSAASAFAPPSAYASSDVHVLVKADGSREWLERTDGPLDRLYVVVPGENGAYRLAVGAARRALYRSADLSDARLQGVQ